MSDSPYANMQQSSQASSRHEGRDSNLALPYEVTSPFHHVPQFFFSKPVIFASTCFGSSLMHSVFQFYYVKVYIDYYHIPEDWFNWMQTVYMVWNAINDPLLGYCQDHSHCSIVRSRRHTIYYGAPIWVLTFLIPWFPWTSYSGRGWLCGLHLVISLCAYDTLYTHVLLANGCILAEMAETPEDRVRFYQCGTFASLIGSTSVLFCETLSNHLSNFFAFQLCCIVIAVMACVAVMHTGRHAVTKYDIGSTDEEQVKAEYSLTSDRSTEFSLIRLTLQIFSQKNFFWFVQINFFNELHINFVASMSRMISEVLVASSVSLAVWDLYCGAIMILPRVMQVLLFPVLSKFGYYNVYRVIFVLVSASALLMFVIGDGHPWLFMIYTLTDSVLSGGKSSLAGLPLSDIIDEDYKINKRRHPVSSMVFGTNALITKPAASLAPMLAVSILNSYGYQQHQASLLSARSLDRLKEVMFTLSCVLPLCIGTVQYLLMSQYTIRKSHIKCKQKHDIVCV